MTYLRHKVSSLPKVVGVDDQNGSRFSDGTGGYLSYGPYFHLDPGSYAAGYYIRRVGPIANRLLTVDVFSAGSPELGKIEFYDSDLFDDIARLFYVTFQLDKPKEQLEVRLHVSNTVLIEAHSLVVLSLNSRRWGS